MCDTLADFKQQTGDKLCLCISTDKELIEEYAKSLNAHGYTLEQIIVASDKESFDPSGMNLGVDVTVIPSFKAVAKNVISAAKENGFVLITGDTKTADEVRKEVLRILEF